MHNPSLCALHEALEQALPPPEGAHQEVYRAARYSLLSGGKRLRPQLVLTTAKSLSPVPDCKTTFSRALEAAVAVELIHTYSLIHDDLPGMDNDDFRRGKPTLHKVFPEGQAILAGDLLLTHAFERLAASELFEPTERLQMIRTLSQRAGGEGMIGGQSIDLFHTHQAKAHTKESLDLLHSMKTGALIQASVELGAISAKAPQAHQEVLKKFALALGLAFQIIDDILDVTHSQEKHGKEHSSDLENDKTTYVSLLGLEASRREAESILDLATKELDSLDYDFAELKNLAHHLVYREK